MRGACTSIDNDNNHPSFKLSAPRSDLSAWTSARILTMTTITGPVSSLHMQKECCKVSCAGLVTLGRRGPVPAAGTDTITSINHGARLVSRRRQGHDKLYRPAHGGAVAHHKRTKGNGETAQATHGPQGPQSTFTLKMFEIVPKPK